MSAFILPTTHIDAVLTAGLWLADDEPVSWFWPPIEADSDRGSWISAELRRQARERRQELTEATAGRVGAMLLAESARSVDHRYDEEEIEPPYLFTALPGTPDPVVVLKALDCYEYHSCEHPGWATSEAAAFCAALRRHAIHALPGYGAAPWDIDDPNVFVRAGTGAC